MQSDVIISNVIDDVTNKLKEINTVNEIRLFGSQVKSYNINSDIDILVLCSNNDSYELIMEKLSKIVNEYKILIHPVIKIINKNEVITNRFIIKYVLNESRILFNRNEKDITKHWK